MPARVFGIEERDALRVSMLEAGFRLIKKHGMTHASVEKITNSAGLGKSTFYNFFPSKEHFVMEIIAYQRDQAKARFDDALGGREKMTMEEGKRYLKSLVLGGDSIYQYLTPEDEKRLRAAMPGHQHAVPEKKPETMKSLLSHMEGVRGDVDMKLVANLFKMMSLTMFHREQMHRDALENTFERMYQLVFDCVFEGREG